MFLRKKEKNVVTVLSVSGCGVVCWYKHLKAFQMKNHIYTLWSYLNLLGEMFVCMCVSERERERVWDKTGLWLVYERYKKRKARD